MVEPVGSAARDEIIVAVLAQGGVSLHTGRAANGLCCEDLGVEVHHEGQHHYGNGLGQGRYGAVGGERRWGDMTPASGNIRKCVQLSCSTYLNQESLEVYKGIRWILL